LIGKIGGPTNFLEWAGVHGEGGRWFLVRDGHVEVLPSVLETAGDGGSEFSWMSIGNS